MKALTLHQPWASLIALDVKRIETRAWSTSYRGPLAIHAARTMPSYANRYISGATASRDAWGDWFVHFSSTPSAPIPSGLPAPRYGEMGYPLPLGAVVATCTLVDVVPMVDYGDAVHDFEDFVDVAPDCLTLFRARCSDADLTNQRPYGGFAPGRFAWLLADIEPLAEPVPAKGRQGLWEWAAALDATAV